MSAFNARQRACLLIGELDTFANHSAKIDIATGALEAARAEGRAEAEDDLRDEVAMRSFAAATAGPGYQARQGEGLAEAAARYAEAAFTAADAFMAERARRRGGS